MFGFLSGCGVASFSVGIPQVSYWYPQAGRAPCSAPIGGIGNLAPGLFTLILPFAIAALGLAGSYLAWLVFLLLGTAIYGWLARDAYYLPVARARPSDAEEAREVRKAVGQELFPAEYRLGAAASSRPTRPAPGAWSFLYFVSFGGFLALTAWFPTYWINLHHLDTDRRACSAASASRCWRR